MRDVDPHRTDSTESSDNAATGQSSGGVVATAGFDDDDLEPTIVRGRE
ncbi:hypothetical protein [Saccharomonospora sp. NB11]|jgi:hypothetical protein|nr:hypothetical protein [Saccharomonospora sp. NB11]